jgi:hypothetical protein
MFYMIYAAKPTSMSGITFLKILAEDEMAFDMLYCVAFEMLDAHWLAMRASYMEFNVTLSLCPFCHVNWVLLFVGHCKFTNL